MKILIEAEASRWHLERKGTGITTTTATADIAGTDVLILVIMKIVIT